MAMQRWYEWASLELFINIHVIQYSGSSSTLRRGLQPAAAAWVLDNMNIDEHEADISNSNSLQRVNMASKHKSETEGKQPKIRAKRLEKASFQQAWRLDYPWLLLEDGKMF